jgi:hypothetical protein
MFPRSGANPTLTRAAVLAIRLHSRWLTRALRTGRFPRIPTRRLYPDGSGGFAELLADPAGRAWTERWWREALCDDD